ncbi:hypothetical protein [Microbacterium sp. P04]|uniref:hypothetical protein n=1 Tax=Microbacterium sp. P04 TaxID=3366947 RepID=UPI003745F40F
MSEQSMPEHRGFRHWLDVRFRSPAAIYGVIVFAAFVTISADHAENAWDMLGSSVGTLIVFFIAHVFAHTLTDHGEHGLGRATRRAVQHSAGMLYASIPATIVLIIGGVQGTPPDDLDDLSLWATMGVLAVLGYNAYARRGANVTMRLLGAAGTAALGLFIVLLEYAIH